MEKENQTDAFIHMHSLGSDEEMSNTQNISTNKFITRITKKARINAKSPTCPVCGKKCSSFCNSHSVPLFTLQNIAEQGNVYIPLQGELPATGNYTGIKKAGTFHLICDNCDNTIFRDYETPAAYDQPPSDKMLAQIALKNYLQMIYKRKMENETYKLLEQRLDNFTTVPGQGKTVEEIDLYEYQTHFKYALRALSWKNTPRFYLCFFQPLDYVVPYAAQTSIPLIVDLQDNLINNIYNLSEEYKLEQLHVAVFPLKETSAIMLFYEQGEKRYRKFMKQLKRLDFEDQLAVINFLIFSYTENVFINPTVYNTVWENSKFREVCRKTTSAKSSFGIRNPLRNAMQSYSFSNRDNVPNLLSRDYALVRPQDVS